jgi:hypothetical protein
MSLKIPSKPAINQPHAPKLSGASQMSPKALIAALVLSVSLSVSQALALTPEELTKAQEIGSQLTPPVDIAELLAEAEKYGIECDPTTKNRIRICKQRIENAQIDVEIEATKAEIEASRERTEASRVRTQVNLEEAERLKADTERTRQENAELIRELQQIIDEKNR